LKNPTTLTGLEIVHLTAVTTELTTAATDLTLAIVAAVCAFYLARWWSRDPWRAALWCAAIGLLAVSSLLGAIAHGFELSVIAQDRLWAALYLMLGLTVSLFVVAAAYDWRGDRLARRLVAPMLLVGVGFFAVTRLVAGTFLVFVVYEAAAMFFAFGVYVTLEAHKRLRGAGVVAVGIALSILAAAIQATHAVRVTIIWPFDHNGVFHIVQLVGVMAIVTGVGIGFSPVRPATARLEEDLES